ncbi:FAD-dependent thymidylate synthase [Helicobacter ailurogastricus]|uniref:Flavin-dependent thymidylate synthase n=1 Tax=Helicobacter ailurogastricus TaxID=1578720 RepID=A0A0K2Y0Q8_9HELI|nr:FAD-dependent thymidylate synthase [Helicobacter ailurogastricus]BDQ28354.1 flavin-dependent thymidylate synthase [Helicobacter ailurogastricus]CRF52886.1 Thymidylate synthase thyX [Helicobacter ailurogastricus]
MQVLLKHATPLSCCYEAIRTCYQSFGYSDNGGRKDLELIDRVANKYRHNSTLEHLFYNFDIQGISRACLQELARHRMASFSVKSSRYTLRELKREESFLPLEAKNLERAQKFLVFTGIEAVDRASVHALENLRTLIVQNIKNDHAKFAMPESYKTSLAFSLNARSLQNFLSLRTDSKALWEIRALALKIYEALPEEHRYLFTHCIQNENPTPC